MKLVQLTGALLLLGALGGCGDDGGDGAGGQGLVATGGGGAGGTAGTGGTGASAGEGGAPPGCGDGTRTPDEACDDGNHQSHDGCSSGCTVEEPTWTKLEPAASPGRRVDHDVAYDVGRDRLVLFGGYQAAALRETWDFDMSAWWQVLPAGEPSARYDHAMVFDTSGHVVLLYGGNAGGGLTGLDDTWTFNGTTWSPALTGTPPPPRYQHAMAFDANRGCAVAFGGTHAGATLGDTIEYAGGGWSGVTPTASPPPRFGHAMVYHPVLDRVVLFGGYDDTGSIEYDDTWEYDGTTWAPVTPATIPPHRRFHHLAYDAARDCIVMFGGWDGAEDRADTWEYAGGDWVETSPSPAPRGGPMAYDSLRRRVLLVDAATGSAVSDTWAYRLASAWPDEICDEPTDEDDDGLGECADPDCEGLPCDGGSCSGGTCQ